MAEGECLHEETTPRVKQGFSVLVKEEEEEEEGRRRTYFGCHAWQKASASMKGQHLESSKDSQSWLREFLKVFFGIQGG